MQVKKVKDGFASSPVAGRVYDLLIRLAAKKLSGHGLLIEHLPTGSRCIKEENTK